MQHLRLLETEVNPPASTDTWVSLLLRRQTALPRRSARWEGGNRTATFPIELRYRSPIAGGNEFGFVRIADRDPPSKQYLKDLDKKMYT
jgi:hypothetical protein